MKWTQEELEKLYREANEKAAKDPEFAKKLMEDPQKTLEEMTGSKLPDGFVLERITGDSKYAAAYLKPSFAGGEIDLNTLKEVPGGLSVFLIVSACGAAVGIGPDTGACGAQACVGDSCGAAACGAAACGGNACGANVCAADGGCAGDACASNACAGNTGCAGHACTGDGCGGNVGCAANLCTTAACGGNVGCKANACVKDV